MKGLVFFDTNVLVYAADSTARTKRERAIALIDEHRHDNSLVISLQVLQEYYTAATRKLGAPADTAQREVELLSRGRLLRFTEHDVIASIERRRLHKISFSDAMIVHAARLAGAAVLYNEDFAHGAAIDRRSARAQPLQSFVAATLRFPCEWLPRCSR
jgi:predicted nucleic acid-binding protein